MGEASADKEGDAADKGEATADEAAEADALPKRKRRAKRAPAEAAADEGAAEATEVAADEPAVEATEAAADEGAAEEKTATEAAADEAAAEEQTTSAATWTPYSGDEFSEFITY